jgi:hypothetical protein
MSLCRCLGDLRTMYGLFESVGDTWVSLNTGEHIGSAYEQSKPCSFLSAGLKSPLSDRQRKFVDDFVTKIKS